MQDFETQRQQLIDTGKDLNDSDEDWQSIYSILFTLSSCDNDFETSEESLDALSDIEIFGLRAKGKRPRSPTPSETSESSSESSSDSFISAPSQSGTP